MNAHSFNGVARKAACQIALGCHKMPQRSRVDFSERRLMQNLHHSVRKHRQRVGNYNAIWPARCGVGLAYRKHGKEK